MAIQIVCLSCRATLRFTRYVLGTNVTCPKCRAVLPSPEPLPPSPAVPTARPVADDLDFRDTPATRHELSPARGQPLVLWVSAGLAGVVVLAVTALLLLTPGKPSADVPLPTVDATTPPAPPPVVQSPPVAPAKLTREQVYDKVLPSVVFILCTERTSGGITYTGYGSGSLIHGSRRLVLTNHHVVVGCQEFTVFFPDLDAKKGLLTDPKLYVDRATTVGVSGKVVASDARLDLALIELARLPKSAEPLALAAAPAATGSTVLSVGASGVKKEDFSGTLWRLSSGDVRGRYEQQMTYDNGQRVRAMVLETQKPVNKGDSGGPTVNEDGELVGVVSSFDVSKNAVMSDIDLTEVRGFLKAHTAKGGWQWVDTSAAPPAKGPRPSRADRVAVLTVALKTQKGAELVATLRQIAAHGPDARAAIPDLIRLLDDPNAAVQSATRAALEAVGDPGTAEEWAVTGALAGTAPQARRYALTLFANGRKSTREQIPPLIAAADTGTDVDERTLAIRALGNVPAEAKPSVIPPLMAALDDDSPALAVAADAALTALMPYPKELTATFVESLTAQNPRRRRLAVRSLAPLAESVRQAADWFVPRLRDADAQVKAQSLDALARWERDAGRTISAEAVTACLREKDPSVRAAAVRAIGRLGLSAAIPKLLPLLAEPGPAEFKTLLPDVLLSLESPTPEMADELFAALFAQSPLAFPERTLRKLTESKRPLRVHLPAIAPCLRDGKEPVRLAALAAMAEAKLDAETWAGDIAAALGGSDAEVDLALKSLTAIGKTGAAQLASTLRSDLPTTTRERVYIALGELAAVAPADCCERLIADAEKHPKSADLIARAVASFAPAIPLARLKEIAYSENVGRKLERKSFYAVPYQVWALETVGLLDIQKFEVVEQKKVRDWLFNKKHYDRDPSCQDAAARSLAAVERKMANVPEKK